MKEFLQGRIELVKHLAVDVLQAHYADMVLILTAVLSACASRRWPGDRIDRKRFIELLVVHSPRCSRTSWVSIPALINEGLVRESETLYGIPGSSTRIYRDDEIDLSFEDAKRKYSNVPSKELREHCYAALVYKWLRCGYSHEYWANENITHVPATDEEARVSYIGRSTKDGHRRMVSFHLEYLIDLAEHHVSILPSDACPEPSTWWVEKG